MQLGSQYQILRRLNQTVALEQSIEIQSGTADHNWQFLTPTDIFKRSISLLLECVDTEFLTGIKQIDQMIRNVAILV